MKEKAIIVDFDGTLSDTKHREHFVQSKPKQWQAFFEAATDDPLNQWCFEIINSMVAQGYKIILLTGRPEWMRGLSENWLEKYQVPYDLFLMRKDDDHQGDPDMKWEAYQESIVDQYDILFTLEDRQRVVDMWREKGLTCLQCAKGDF